jgi:CO/xanthine dehydrogenase Mo-binding subunit
MLKVASDMLEASTEDLVLENGYVSINGVPGSGVTVAEVAAHAQKIVGPLAGSGSVTGKGVKAEPGCARGHFIEAVDIPIFAVHDCEVAVDPGTGHVEVLSYTVVQDVGRALNPRAIQGQVQGGVVQGLGYALHEEMTIDENGRVRQDGLETYRLPLAQDVLPVRMDLYEGAPSMGPFGIKGAGEVPILNVAAAVACAVSNAIGRPVQQLPLTPPRVLSLLLDRERPVKHRHIAPNCPEASLVIRKTMRPSPSAIDRKQGSFHGCKDDPCADPRHLLPPSEPGSASLQERRRHDRHR